MIKRKKRWLIVHQEYMGFEGMVVQSVFLQNYDPPPQQWHHPQWAVSSSLTHQLRKYYIVESFGSISQLRLPFFRQLQLVSIDIKLHVFGTFCLILDYLIQPGTSMSTLTYSVFFCSNWLPLLGGLLFSKEKRQRK